MNWGYSKKKKQSYVKTLKTKTLSMKSSVKTDGKVLKSKPLTKKKHQVMDIILNIPEYRDELKKMHNEGRLSEREFEVWSKRKAQELKTDKQLQDKIQRRLVLLNKSLPKNKKLFALRDYNGLLDKHTTDLENMLYNIKKLHGKYADSRVGVYKIDETTRNISPCRVCGCATHSKKSVCRDCQEMEKEAFG